MPFSPPPITAVNFTTTGQAYTPPAGDAANFFLAGLAPVQGSGAVTVDFLPAGHGEFVSLSVDGAGLAAVEFLPTGIGAIGVAGNAAVAVGFSAAGTGAHGEAGAGAVALGFAPDGAGLVARYELFGEIRKDGMLVNRLVRAYRRDSGELVGEALTAAGKFRVNTGFEAREHYIVPLDMANDATDWLPPTANRIISVLAQDAV